MHISIYFLFSDTMNLLMVATGCLFCILVSLTGIHGQAYHFSKGWFPGKRSLYPHMSPLTAPHMDSSYRYPNNAHFIGQRSQSGPGRNDNPERCSISASVRWKIQKLIQVLISVFLHFSVS